MGWWVSTHLKNMSQFGFIFPNFRVENKLIFELPPPRLGWFYRNFHGKSVTTSLHSKVRSMVAFRWSNWILASSASTWTQRWTPHPPWGRSWVANSGSERRCEKKDPTNAEWLWSYSYKIDSHLIQLILSCNDLRTIAIQFKTATACRIWLWHTLAADQRQRWKISSKCNHKTQHDSPPSAFCLSSSSISSFFLRSTTQLKHHMSSIILLLRENHWTLARPLFLCLLPSASF